MSVREFGGVLFHRALDRISDYDRRNGGKRCRKIVVHTHTGQRRFREHCENTALFLLLYDCVYRSWRKFVRTAHETTGFNYNKRPPVIIILDVPPTLSAHALYADTMPCTALLHTTATIQLLRYTYTPALYNCKYTDLFVYTHTHIRTVSSLLYTSCRAVRTRGCRRRWAGDGWWSSTCAFLIRATCK